MTGSAPFQSKYTPEQRDAVASARLDRNIPAKRVLELAAAGELTAPDGTKLAPFEMKHGTVGTVVSKARRERMGTAPGAVAQLPHRDAIEILRRQILSAVEHKMRALRRRLERNESSVTFEELRQATRALREAQALPAKDEHAKPAPGAKVNGQTTEGQNRGDTLGGSLLAAHRKQGATAQGEPTQSNGTTENTENGAAQQEDEAQEREGVEEDAPGSFARRSAAAQLVA